MKFKLAEKCDLLNIKGMYKKIVENMNNNNIKIWDEIYPCEFFKDDIENKNLYILKEGNIIVSAFALCESNIGESYLKWKDTTSKVLYLDRFGVNVDYLKQGIGATMLKNAMKIAKQKDAKYLRLFVVDINKPAINLYMKNGFEQVDGLYEEKVDDFVLREYGFEIEVID